MAKHIFKGTVSRAVVQRVKTETGFTTVPDGALTGDATLEIDVDRIIQGLGQRALCSALGCSTVMHGAIVLRISNKRKT
jgi:hypothetical protein